MTRAEIEGDIAAARERLAGNIAELINQVHPRSVVHNTIADARQLVAGEIQQVKDQLVGADGVRVERVALLGVAAGGVIAFALVMRSIFRR
jgi:hypothetical protein